MAQIINQDVFEELVLKADKPVPVDFYADWCGPCKMMAPILGELSNEKGDQLTIYKINVDDNQEVAKQYRVMSIPNMILFKNGEKVTSVVGSVSKNDLWKKLKKNYNHRSEVWSKAAQRWAALCVCALRRMFEKQEKRMCMDLSFVRACVVRARRRV